MDSVSNGGTEVLALRYGTLTAHASELFYGHSAHRHADALRTMDYFFWVIRVDGEIILVDTGFTEGAAIKRGRTSLATPIERLKEVGISTDDVTRIIVSHCHYDHIGNLNAFPRAQIVMSGPEFQFWFNDPIARKPLYSQSVEPDELGYIHDKYLRADVELVSGVQEVASGVVCHPLPGHTPGQIGVMVRLASSSALLASDAVHLYEELTDDKPFAVLDSVADMYRTYNTIRELVSPHDVVLVAGHDPLVMERFELVEGEDGPIGARIE